MAFKAQSQSRATIQVLGEFKFPKQAILKNKSISLMGINK
jgi:hypothetical protein